VSERPFHHGNLKSELLDRAARTLRESGVDALSLRELARQAGVSHGAPRRHFADRQALLDALAEQGFRRLDESVRAIVTADAPYRERFRTLAAGYVDVAVTDGALMDLMFSAKDASGQVRAAAAAFFATMGAFFDEGHRSGRLASGDPFRLQMLLVSTLQGIATLITAGRLAPADAPGLLDEATALFLRPDR
jgi:AcrR family transcriptional regulator